MAVGDVHTFKKGDRWVNKVEGNKRISNHAPTKKEAQRIGRRMALKRGSDHIIYTADGEVGRHNTYITRDPDRPTPGQIKAAGGTAYATMIGRAIGSR